MTTRRGQRGFRRAGELSADRLEMPVARARELRLATAWRKVAGEAIAHRAPVRGIRRGVLEIEVPDERWASTLRELIPRLAGRLAGGYPDLGVKKLRLRLAGEVETPRARAIPPAGDATAADDSAPFPDGDPPPPAEHSSPREAREEEETAAPIEERLGRLADEYLDRSSRRGQKP